MAIAKSGFTLIEIIVVLVIIAIMSSVAIIGINAPTYTNFISDVNKVSSLFNIINDEAVYTNSVISCEIFSHGLNCYKYKNEEWTELKLYNLISWSWPKKLYIEEAYLSGKILKEKEKISFLPNGNMSPMSFKITNGKFTTWIDGNLSGDFEIHN